MGRAPSATVIDLKRVSGVLPPEASLALFTFEVRLTRSNASDAGPVLQPVDALETAVFTIGHSNRPIAEFIGLLKASQIELVVDVRKMPRSRSNPQFNLEVLPTELSPHQIGYIHIAELGGLRSRGGVRDPSQNTLWRNRSFRNYADYALTAPFRAGLSQLRLLADQRRSAIMCAEVLWWRCHRRIIADYLLAGGRPVLHIMGPGLVTPANLTLGAIQCEPDVLIYRGSEPDC